MSGSSSSSRAKRCSLERARSPHASGALCESRTRSAPTRRVSADCDPARRTTNSFSATPAASSTRRRLRRARRRRRRRRRRGSVSSVAQPALLFVATRRVGRCSAAATPRWAALMRSAASLDTIVVGASSAWPRAAPMIRLSGLGGVEAVLDQEVLADAVDLDLQAAVADRHRAGERATVADAQVLDRAQRGAGRPPDVVGPALQPVELLDDGQRDHDVAPVEREHAAGVGDQDRGVERRSGSAPSTDPHLPPHPRAPSARARQRAGDRSTPLLVGS